MSQSKPQGRSYWVEHIEAWRASGVSRTEYCQNSWTVAKNPWLVDLAIGSGTTGAVGSGGAALSAC